MTIIFDSDWLKIATAIWDHWQQGNLLCVEQIEEDL